VNRLAEIRHVLSASSDPGNPSAEELVQLLSDVQHIAVVGLSRNLEKPARRVPSYLAAKGYDVIPVNPNSNRLLGRVSYPTLGDVPDGVHPVLAFRPSDHAGPVVIDALDRPDNPAIWLQTGVVARPEVDRARAEGRTTIQDLCIFRVHRVIAE
jgi:predicted CoA-binding protein